MASNLHTVKTRDEAIAEFENFILPVIKRQYESDGVPDYTARSTAWNDYTDGLREDAEISDWQYANWDHPDCNYAPWER